MADAARDALATRPTTLAEAVSAVREQTGRVVAAGPEGAADADAAVTIDTLSGQRWPVRLSIKQWAATVVCIDLVLGVVVVRLAGDPQLTLYLYFAIVGTLSAAIDMAVMRLPNWLTLPSYPAAVVCLSFAAIELNESDAMFRALAAGLVTLAVFAVLCATTSTGLGDLKYAGVVGIVLGSRGWGTVVEGFALTWLLAFVWGVALMCRGQLTSRMPLGPFMTAGALLALLWR